MTGRGNSEDRRTVGPELLSIVEEFRRATDRDHLWRLLHRGMAAHGVSGCLYGTEAFSSGETSPFYVLNGFDDAWLDDKMSQELFYCDEFVKVARTFSAPLLWGDAARISDMTPDGWRSLAVDFDHGVVTGVTIPISFGGGYGASGIGLHADGLSFAEFGDIWWENGAEITAIAHAFDVAIRRECGMEMFALTTTERDCLNYLAGGMRSQRVGERLGLTDKQTFRLVDKVRGKLNAATTAQALAIALMYSLIDP